MEEKETLSPQHLHELEGVLSSLLTNQEIIIEQNRKLLAAKKMERIWALVKTGLWVVVLGLSVLLLPQIIASTMDEVSSVLGIGNLKELTQTINQTSDGGNNNLMKNLQNLDPQKVEQIKKLLQ